MANILIVEDEKAMQDILADYMRKQVISAHSFIGRLSQGMMAGVVYIKILMLLFIAVPIVCALLGVSGPLAVICCLVPSQPAFEGIMALSAGSMGAAAKAAGILAIHCTAWFALYILIFARHKRQII